MYVGCSAGKHRSPMMAFCWLMSLPHTAFENSPATEFGGTSPERVAQEFYGKFDDDLLQKYYQDVKLGYIPDRLPEMYQLMRQMPDAPFRVILMNMLVAERTAYPES